MQKATSAKLGDYFDGLIADLTASGRYPTTTETLRAGLRLLEEQEAEYLTKLETLRQALVEGEESGESDRSFKEIIAEAREELKAELHGG